MRQNQRPVMIESMERRLHLDASQLTTSIVSSTIAASASDESVIKGAVVVDVANDSGVTQKIKAKVELLAGGQVLTSKSSPISLSAGQSRIFNLGVSVGKGKIADGTYALSAEVSQAGGLFSESVAGPTLVVRPPIVSLSETEVFRKLPTTVAPGVKFGTTDIVSITNSGSDPSADPLTIDVYASTDDSITGAVLLATAKKKITINPGRTAAVSIGIKENAGLAAGTYRLISAVTQSNSTLTTTNPAAAPVLDVPGPVTDPEFVETILGVTPLYTNQSSGTVSEIDVQMFIENKGAGTDASSQYTLYVSSSPTFGSTATEISSLPLTQALPGADAGKSFQVDFGVAQPNPISFNGSSYYVFVQVTDPKGDVTLGADATPVVIGS